MRWEGGRRSGNIDDRRGIGPVGAVGGIGVGGIVVALIGIFVFGMDPGQVMNMVSEGGGTGAQVQQQAGKQGSPQDQAGAFVDVIETSTTDVWSQLFQRAGQRYAPPEDVVLYDQATGTGCGTGQAAMGPFYCPNDRKVYLDLSFWNELESQFGAKGEFARAYVIAHEVGHHVQNLTGSLRNSRGGSGAESGAVRVELQADCYAGVWAAHAGAASGGRITLEQGDLESGLGAASAVGDDTIQRRTQGRVVPDAFTHGTAEQRMRWFRVGYESGDPGQCDTFKARRL
ncbi:KPN_02809 family neutral zinc metallopeptidase [Caulobacter mirabilis]|uniref:Flagellar biosynthesis protein FlgM n=1 Tax=Caulobacter mirabilis TaxID=69666 RepID=A0A2D2AWD1_9CAUL|nr:neutral zinc metallopeptidase [Caulobacter mirabilis]ATQ42281.1 flagellar biosynthesis protein FlgM [Caulobacter mirabilis]